MKRWNGWGDDTIHAHLGPLTRAFLEAEIGVGVPHTDATLAEVVAQVPESSLPPHPLIDTTPIQRVLHARGQSLADWVALRRGQVGRVPDGVAFPTTREEVRSLLRYAYDHNITVIPYGGGTSVVGHINPTAGERPVVTVSLEKLNRVIEIDTQAAIATMEAGIPGPLLEAAPRAKGLTLGHFPQSFDYSTLGGWIATRSSGQQSRRYGRIDQMVLGVEIETPTGPLSIRPVPASSAGPDLKQIVLGSEGRLGIITQATVRCTPLPEQERFVGIFFKEWTSAVAAIRTLAQSSLSLSMLRLSTPQETFVNVALSGNALFNKIFGMVNSRRKACMAVVGVTGSKAQVKQTENAIGHVVRRHGGIVAGTFLGKQWRKSRFRTPYLRNTLWEAGYAVDTIETATTWDKVPVLLDSMESAIRGAMPPSPGKVLVFTHLSHVYSEGSSIYTTCIFPLSPNLDDTQHAWNAMKRAASETIVAAGGTISHQHGVGTDHKPYARVEKGAVGMSLLQSALHSVDPKGLMNPDKLLDSDTISEVKE